MYREKFEFYHLKNAIVHPFYDIYLSNGDFLYMLKNFIWGPDYQNTDIVTSSESYEHVIFIPFYFQTFFGHIINECIGSLLSIPRWVWSLNPVIVTDADQKLIRLHLKIADLPKVRIVSGHVFGANVFICKAVEPWHGFGIHYFPMLKKKIDDFFQLNTIEPNLYCFMNKEYGVRHFLNMDEMIEVARNVTQLDWIKLENNFRQRAVFAKTLASTKILVIPGGSIIFNSVYMKEHSGIVILMACFIDMPNIAINYYNRIWSIAVTHINMSHYEGPGYGNIPRIINAIEIMIYTVNNQKFPPNHNLFMPLNKTFQKIAYYTKGDSFTSWPQPIKTAIRANLSSVGNSPIE